MKHLAADEILDYLKGRTGPETSALIRRHLEECEVCRCELAALETTTTWIEAWPDEAVPDDVLGRVKDTLSGLSPVPVEALPANGSARRSGRPWPARFATAAAAIVALLLVQTFLWTPFGTTVNVQGLLTLAPPAMAMTAGQTVPDTVLVITLHPDGTVSVPLIEGQLAFDDLTDRLPGMVGADRWRTILLLGSDPEHPVSIRLDRFEALKEALGIDNLRVGSGVVGVAPFFWSHSHPTWSFRRGVPFVARGDSLNLPAFFNEFAVPAREEGLQWIFSPGQGLPGHWVYRPEEEGGSIFAFSPGSWSVPGQWFASGPGAGSDAEAVLEYSALTEGNGITAAITDEGRIIFSRGTAEENLAVEQLRALAELIPDLHVKILVPEDRLDQARELEFAARQLGIESIEIVKVKKK